MAIPQNCARVVLSGSLPGGEIWSSGFWMGNIIIQSQAQATAYAQSMHDILASNVEPNGGMTMLLARFMSTHSSWDKTTVYCYRNGGTHAEFIGEHVTEAPPGFQACTLPNQCCLVLSLRSTTPGRRNRGRMYLPAVGATVDGTTGQATPAHMSYLIASWQNSFNAMETAELGHLGVVSTVGSTVTDVSTLILDSRFDIQRRRANSEAISTVDTLPLAI